MPVEAGTYLPLQRYSVTIKLVETASNASRESYDRKGEMYMKVAAPLEMELKLFEERRKEWSQSHLGKFVVIQDSNVLEGFFDNYADAFTAGLRGFGVGRSFLVKQIWKTEPVYFVA